MGFVDYAELEGYGYSLSYWNDDVSHLKEKNWSERPSQEEVDTYVVWRETLSALRQDSIGKHLHLVVEEDTSTDATASKLNRNSAEVQAAIEKVTSWIED